MASALANKEIPDSAQRGRPPSVLLATIALLLLAAAIAAAGAAPLVGDMFGVVYEYVALFATSALFLGALVVTPVDGALGGRLVHWLSFVNPLFRAYKEEVHATEEANIRNRTLYSKMESVLAAYHLTLSSELTVPVATLGEKRKDIKRQDLAKEAAAAICTDSALINDGETLALQLELLYCDYFGLMTREPWQALTKDQKATLAPLLLMADRFAPTIVWPEAKGRWEKVVGEVFKKTDEFDISLVHDIVVHLNDLWRLATKFYADARENHLPEAADWSGDAPSEAFMDFVANELPPTRSELHRLEESKMAVDLVSHVAKQLIAKMDPPAEGDPAMTAFVSAGLFLLGGHRHPKLRPELARQAHEGKGELGDFAAKVLLARMWQLNQKQVDRKPGVPQMQPEISLQELLCNWKKWEKLAREAYEERLTENLLATIRKQVRHGSWPTTPPIEWMLDKFTDANKQSQQQIKDTVLETRQDLEKLGVTVNHTFSAPVKALLDKINEFDLTASHDDLKRSMKDLVAASEFAQAQPIEDLAQPIEDLAEIIHTLEANDVDVVQTLHKLEVVDGSVVKRVDSLVNTDHELHDAIDRLTDAFPSTSGRYLLTWKARSGPLADLIDYLAEETHKPGLPTVGRYVFEHYTPYARIGRIPGEQDFDAFFAGLARDLGQVCHHRKRIVPSHDWSTHPLRKAVITVQRIGVPKQTTVRCQ